MSALDASLDAAAVVLVLTAQDIDEWPVSVEERTVIAALIRDQLPEVVRAVTGR